MNDGLALCSLAWGQKSGYAVVSLRDPHLDKNDPKYWRDVPFNWPDDESKIEKLFDRASQNSSKDIYWAPAIFSVPKRDKTKIADGLDVLWADLDNVEPEDIPERLKPSALWKTSPHHYQALWRIDPTPPEVQTLLNRRLSYALGADKGGWDLTQVLRVPDTPNLKYKRVRVKLESLQPNGSAYHPRSLGRLLPALPDVQIESSPAGLIVIELQKDVLARHKVPARALQILKSRTAQQGTRSDRLWELECILAEAGLNVSEIVSVIRPSVWNKFSGRRNEVDQLVSEARKAMVHIGVGEDVTANVTTNIDVTTQDTIDEEISRPLTWPEFDRDHKPIKWLVNEVWGQSEVGFISGLPKTYKSWFALDLAVSVATGKKFLNSYACNQSNVLLIQEEDPKPVMQDRLVKIAAQKDLVWIKEISKTQFEMMYALPENLYIVSNQGFQITGDDWMEALQSWIEDLKIGLVILDPLMMMVEGVDEFKAFEMMASIFKPLKRLRADTQAAICVVHHHTKAAKESGGQAMYGSVALWAWEESALHLSIASPGRVTVDRFSKHAQLGPITVELSNLDEEYAPVVFSGVGGRELLDVVATFEDGVTVEELVKITKMSRESIKRGVKQLSGEGKLEKSMAPPTPGQRGRRPVVWRVPKEAR